MLCLLWSLLLGAVAQGVVEEGREVTLEGMSEEELWNEWDRVREEWRKTDAELNQYLWEIRGAMLTAEKIQHYKRLHETLDKAQEKEDRIREALRKLRGY